MELGEELAPGVVADAFVFVPLQPAVITRDAIPISNDIFLSLMKTWRSIDLG